MKKIPIMLVILDGFGHSDLIKHNAVFHAKTPHLDKWKKQYPYTLLHASGTYVGLPEGYIGNSQVGHMTIGSGRIIEQSLTRINKLIQNKTFFEHPILRKQCTQLQKKNRALHIVGLISNAGVHGHIDHIKEYCEFAKMHNVPRVYIHAFLDGRDTSPRSAAIYLEQLEPILKKYNATLASLHGRFFAMDRDNNLERTQKSYNVLTQKSTHTDILSWKEVIEQNYARNITDEFVEPILLQSEGVVKEGDGIMFANFRADRMRQLATYFLNDNNTSFITTPTWYGKGIITDVLFPAPMVRNTLKEVLSDAGYSFFSIAETEKYAHITYFFNAEKEEVLPNEVRHLIPSYPQRDYITLPEMASPKITAKLVNSLETDPKDVYLVNYANADMVAHSGNFDATVKAIEYLDSQVAQLYELVVEQLDGTLIITSDHGNAECMFDELSGQPSTAHTTNKVPFWFITNQEDVPEVHTLTQLADIAPFLLKYMEINVPKEMQR